MEFSLKESRLTSGWRVVGGLKWEVGQRWCPGHRRGSKQSSTTIGLRVLLTRQPNSFDHMLPVMLKRAAAVGDSWRADAQRAALGKVWGSPSVEGSLAGAQPHSWVGKVGRGEWCRGRGGTAATGLGSPVLWVAGHTHSHPACRQHLLGSKYHILGHTLNLCAQSCILQTKGASQISS